MSRVIDILRKHYPGSWKYDGPPHRWLGPGGLCVIAQSSVPDQFEQWYTEYVWEDSGERVAELYGIPVKLRSCL